MVSVTPCSPKEKLTERRGSKMADSGLLTIAYKEFFDHLRSRRFLLILGILLVIAMVGIMNGVSDYRTSVQSYNSLQQILPQAHETASFVDQYLKVKPSVLQVFYQMSTLFTIVGGFLGIAMGFDLVTKEKESKSLKILLAHPVYRDEVINGKALGAVGAIVLALGIILFVSLAILLVFGIVPDGSELLLILFFCAMTFLFIFSYFAIGLLMSALCEDSGKSLVYTLIIFVILGTFIPAVVSSPIVMNQVIGPMPELPKIVADPAMKDQNRDALDRYDQQTQEYGEKQMKVIDLQYLFSPTQNYAKITTVLMSPKMTSGMLYGSMGMGPSGSLNDTAPDVSVGVTYMKRMDLDFSGMLTLIFGNIIALLVLPSVFFGLAYVSFMRMDVR